MFGFLASIVEAIASTVLLVVGVTVDTTKKISNNPQSSDQSTSTHSPHDDWDGSMS